MGMPQNLKPEQDSDHINGMPRGSWWLVASLSVVILIAFGFYIGHLSGEVDSPKEEWSRLQELFATVKTIVFAAATFIFGREINRESARVNQNRANKADEEKVNAQTQHQEAKREVLEKGAEVKIQLERGQTVANMFRAQFAQNRSMGIKLGTMQADDDSPDMNGFLSQLDEWYPKK